MRAGLAKLVDGCWQPTQELSGKPRSVPLTAVIGGILRHSAVPRKIGRHTLYLPGANGNERRLHRHSAVAIVPAIEAQRYDALLKREEERAAQAARDEARRSANLEALYARQEYLLPYVVDAAASLGQPIWAGVPAEHVMNPTLADALGNETTANGAVIWTGSERNNLRLFAVISPVASRIEPGLVSSWHRRRVRVYAAEEREAERLAQALGSRDLIYLIRADRPLTSMSNSGRRQLTAIQNGRSTRALARALMYGAY